MKKNKLWFQTIILIISGFYISCSSGGGKNNPNPVPDPVIENIESKPSIDGIRLNWDFSSLTKISTGVYSRIIQLNDNSLIAVYETSGNIAVKKSTDLGASWSSQILVFNKTNGVNMASPDILQLDDNSILVCYNPRPPSNNTDATKKYAIKTIKSYDGGLTWTHDRLLFEASHNFEDGCWEPSALQLPNGEIQLFFSNEASYTTSNEQNISLFRSEDKGLTWTSTPQIVSFRVGKRDGMPKPILLNNNEDIVFSIEDNFTENFKPYTIRNTVSQNWSEVIDGYSNKRDYALLDAINNNIYAGAPYLAQLGTGETIISYQGTEDRTGNNLENSEMKVAIGDNEAYGFSKKTIPFNVPSNSSALWNSITVLNDDTVIAVTSSNGLSSTNQTEVWMIKGHVIPEINATNATITIDGIENESLWSTTFPIFIGHIGNTRLKANVFYDNENLYIVSKTTDSNIISQVANTEDNDGIIIYLDPKNKSLVAPGKDIYKIFLSAENMISFYEGDNRVWKKSNKSTTKIICETKIDTSGYAQEMAIPWALLGGKPSLNTRIGFNLELSEKGNNSYIDGISNNVNNQPYTWCTLKLE